MKTPDDLTIHAIIPARAGSKGIKNKNMSILCGKTLLAHTIEHANDAKWIDQTWVSSDARRILNEATQNNAYSIQRPSFLAKDGTPTEPVITHWLGRLKDNQFSYPDYVVLLQCTSPIRRSSDIDAAIYELWKNEHDSLFSANKYHGFIWSKDPNGNLQSLNYNYWDRPRRQDKSTDWYENGSIYVFKPWVVDEDGSRLGFNIGLYEMTLPGSWIQIDQPVDLKLAEFYLRVLGWYW